MLQDDNDPKHRSQIVNHMLNEYGINRLEWLELATFLRAKIHTKYARKKLRASLIY
jgi:hypothetical protein